MKMKQIFIIQSLEFRNPQVTEEAFKIAALKTMLLLQYNLAISKMVHGKK